MLRAAHRAAGIWPPQQFVEKVSIVCTFILPIYVYTRLSHKPMQGSEPQTPLNDDTVATPFLDRFLHTGWGLEHPFQGVWKHQPWLLSAGGVTGYAYSTVPCPDDKFLESSFDSDDVVGVSAWLESLEQAFASQEVFMLMDVCGVAGASMGEGYVLKVIPFEHGRSPFYLQHG